MRLYTLALCLFAVASCGGASSTTEADKPAPADSAADIETLITQAVDNSFRVDKAEQCNYFHGMDKAGMAEGLRYEVEQGKQNGQDKKKEFGLKCIVEATTCDGLKQCANMMD